MSFFTDSDIEKALASETVHIVNLFLLDFLSGEKRYSTEVVDFTDKNGNTWEACGDVIQWSDLVIPRAGLGAASRTYKLPVLSDPEVSNGTAALAMDTDETEYRGRLISHFFQVFDGNGSPIGSPVHLSTHIMDVLNMDGDNNGNLSLTLSCEGLLSTRNSPSYGLVAAEDQKFRYPTDKGLDRQALASQGTIATWPVF